MSQNKKDTKSTSVPAGGGGFGGHMRIVQKPKDTKKTLKQLFSYMQKRNLIIIGFALVFASIAIILQINIPKMLGNATTEIFHQLTSHNPNGFDYNPLAKILAFCLGLYLFSNFFSMLQQWATTHTSQKVTEHLRDELKQKMNTLPVSYFDTHPNGNLLSIAMNDMDNIANTLQQGLSQLVSSIIMFFGILIIMLSISWELTLMAFIIVPLSIIVAKKLGPQVQKYQKAYMQQLGKLNNHIEESYNGHAIIKTFNGEEKSLDKYNTYNNPLFSSGWKVKFFGGIMMPLMMLVKNIGYVCVAVMGGIKVARGQISIGDIQAFLQYTSQFSQPVSQIATIMNSIYSTIASAERVFEVLNEENMTPNSAPNPIHDTNAKVEFDQVAFGYGDKPLIENFNLQVKAGEMIAIVGHTGAGKTTLINLLERFYDVQKGGIYLDGVDTREIKREELHQRFAMVLQDTWLQSASIYDNIMYGNPNATEEEMLEVAKITFVDDFVRKLPDGYHTILNENASNISSGQAQLLSIARALLVNPEILILDEATSNIDTLTEVLIQKAVKTLLENRTSFVIAHRLSTIRNADKIIVMENGSIVETGNHEELLGKNGIYADIYQSQFLNTAN